MNLVIAIVVSLCVGAALGFLYGSRIKAAALAELETLRNSAANAIRGKQ